MSQGFQWYRHGKIETTTVAFPNGAANALYIVATGTCVITLEDGVTTVDLGTPTIGTWLWFKASKYAGTAVVASAY